MQSCIVTQRSLNHKTKSITPSKGSGNNLRHTAQKGQLLGCSDHPLPTNVFLTRAQLPPLESQVIETSSLLITCQSITGSAKWHPAFQKFLAQTSRHNCSHVLHLFLRPLTLPQSIYVLCHNTTFAPSEPSQSGGVEPQRHFWLRVARDFLLLIMKAYFDLLHIIEELSDQVSMYLKNKIIFLTQQQNTTILDNYTTF